MKIGVAQTRPVRGDIDRNIGAHRQLISLAVEQGAEMLVFPELSITGYEPELAKGLATTAADSRFGIFQQLSDRHEITLGIGVPVMNGSGIQIGLVFFQPERESITYAKQYLHPDELPYFVEGRGQVFFTRGNEKIAPSICYELSVPAHAAGASSGGSTVYLSSVAKTAAGAVKAAEILAETARIYSMWVLVANCIGLCDKDDCGGKSSVWNREGRLLTQLNDIDEGILVLDTDTGTVIEKIL
jgi:predicted amidohydrolase